MKTRPKRTFRELLNYVRNLVMNRAEADAKRRGLLENSGRKLTLNERQDILNLMYRDWENTNRDRPNWNHPEVVEAMEGGSHG